jgi:TonB-dependent SusC/RagA subfamily outer membrane receptor
MRTKIFVVIMFSAFCLTTVSGQKSNKKITISGYVVDNSQYPVANAAILIDDKETILVTDTKGYYKIKVNSSARKLSIRVPEAGIVAESIDGRRRINFKLDSRITLQMENLYRAEDDEINVGYGTEQKKNLTSPVNKIDGTEKKFASYSTIYDMIRGEVPGVRVSGKSIKVQNASSFLMGTDPLFVVDGVTVESIDLVMPQMVRSIEVLKGASASIYGSRGSNGVILITLKR